MYKRIALPLALLTAAATTYAGLLPGGSFKSGFHSQAGINGVVGNYFTGFNIIGNPSFLEDPVESMDGYSQKIWSDGIAFHSGIWQQASATPGQLYKATCWQAEQSLGSSQQTFRIGKRVGIDPTGGTDPQAASVVWGNEFWGDSIFHLSEVVAEAQNSTITVFVKVHCPQNWPLAETWQDLVTLDYVYGLQIIGDIYPTAVRGTTVTIVWETSIPSTSRVDYGLGTGYGYYVYDPTLTTDHAVTLSTGLADGTWYHYKVKSTATGYTDVSSKDCAFKTNQIEIVSGPTIPTTDASSGLVQWQTNIPTTSYVEYGLTTGYGGSTPPNPTPTKYHSVTIDGLDPGTTYHCRVRNSAVDYTEQVSGDRVFDTDDLAISTGPNADAWENGATITWSTNGLADSLVEYGLTTAYGETSPLDPTPVRDHEVELSGLLSNRTYHYRVISSAGAQQATSADFAFYTVVESTSPPGWLRSGWNMISVPLEPEPPQVSETFDEIIAAGNDLTNNLYTYFATGGYQIYPLDFLYVGTGFGYWMYLTVPTQETIGGTTYDTDYEMLLLSGWALLGHPFLQPVDWSACSLQKGVETKSVDEAEAAGWIQGTIYYYDGGYKTVKTDGTGDDTQLRPWYAYWMLTNTTGVTLVIPPPAP